MSYGTHATNDTDLKDKYVLWQPGSQLPVTTIFGNRPDAIKAGYVMAARNPGKQFAVCKVVGSVKPVENVKFDSFDEEPSPAKATPKPRLTGIGKTGYGGL